MFRKFLLLLSASLVSLTCWSSAQAQKQKELSDEDLLDLRASVPKIKFDAKNAKSEAGDRVYEAFRFCHELTSQRTRPQYAAALFCSQLDSEFGLQSPVEWQRQLERLFEKPVRKKAEMAKSGQRARIISGKILGLSTKLDWPSNEEVVDIVNAIETNDRIYVVGIAGLAFTKVFVYDKSTAKLLFKVPFSGSIEPGNARPQEDCFIDMTLSEDKSVIFIFSIDIGSVNLDSITTTKEPVCKELFTSVR